MIDQDPFLSDSLHFPTTTEEFCPLGVARADWYHEEFSPLAGLKTDRSACHLGTDSSPAQMGMAAPPGEASPNKRWRSGVAVSLATDPDEAGRISDWRGGRSIDPHRDDPPRERDRSQHPEEMGDLACGEVTGACRRIDPGGGPPLPQTMRAKRSSQGNASQSLLREAQRAATPRGAQAPAQGPPAPTLTGLIFGKAEG